MTNHRKILPLFNNGIWYNISTAWAQNSSQQEKDGFEECPKLTMFDNNFSYLGASQT
jgi:hypothetical protein